MSLNGENASSSNYPSHYERCFTDTARVSRFDCLLKTSSKPRWPPRADAAVLRIVRSSRPSRRMGDAIQRKDATRGAALYPITSFALTRIITLACVDLVDRAAR